MNGATLTLGTLGALALASLVRARTVPPTPSDGTESIPVFAGATTLSRTRYRGVRADIDRVQDVVDAVKLGQRRATATAANWIAKNWELQGSDLVVPMPRSAASRPSILLLAEALVARGVGSVAQDLLSRHLPVASSRHRRREGLAGVTSAQHQASVTVAPPGSGEAHTPLILIDDVFTQGNTSTAMVRRLRAAGWRGPIRVAVVAIAAASPAEVGGVAIGPRTRTLIVPHEAQGSAARDHSFVAYHGTNADFTRFDLKQSTQGILWFSTDRDKIARGDAGIGIPKRILTVRVTIKNPAGWDDYERLSLWELQSKGHDGVILQDPGDPFFDGFVFKAKQIRIVADDKTMGSPNTVTPAGFDRTAMSRSEPSAPVRHLQTHAPALLQGRILDFGSGQGADAEALGATAYDPHHPSARVRTLPKGPFDTVLGLYVLNVLPPTERAAALRLAASAVKPGGSLVLAVRPSADVASTAQGWTRHKDGHQVMGTDGTRDRFQRGFSPAQLRQYATRTLGGAFSPVDVPALSGSVLLVLRRTR